MIIKETITKINKSSIKFDCKMDKRSPFPLYYNYKEYFRWHTSGVARRVIGERTHLLSESIQGDNNKFRYDLWLNIEQMLTLLVSCWVDNVRSAFPYMICILTFSHV